MAIQQTCLTDTFETEMSAVSLPGNTPQLLGCLDAYEVPRWLELGLDYDDIPREPGRAAAETLTKSAKEQLKKYDGIAVKLPEPGVAFQLTDDRFSASEIRKLRNEDIIQVVGEVYKRGSSKKSINIYATNPNAWAWMQAYSAERQSFGCCWKGTGWDNPRDIEGYRCATCGERKTRAEVEEVFFE